MAAGEAEPLLGRSGGYSYHQPTKHDPLVKLGTTRVEDALVSAGLVDEGAKHEVVMRAVFLTIFPVAIFNVVLIVQWRLYHTRPFTSLVFCTFAMCLAASLPQMSRKRGSAGDSFKQKWKDSLSYFCFAAAVAGTIASLLVYYKHLLYFQRYREMRVYSNVAASSPPMLVADGGIVGFSSDSSLDAGQTVGYRSAELGMTLCVAPVIDTSTRPTDPISFFAAGADCCGWRGQFNCGDAIDPKAQSGLLYIPPRQLVEAQMEWAVRDDELMEAFHRAVKLHAAVYGSQASEDVRFLRWARDPREVREEFRHSAVLLAWGYSVLFTCLCAAAAAVASLGPQRLERCAEAAMAICVRRVSKRALSGISRRATARGVP